MNGLKNDLNQYVALLAMQTLAEMAGKPEIIKHTGGKFKDFFRVVAVTSTLFAVGSLPTPAHAETQATETQVQKVKSAKISDAVQESLRSLKAELGLNGQISQNKYDSSNPKLFGVKSGTEKQLIMALSVGMDGGQSLSTEPTMEDFLDKGAKKLEKTFKAYAETLRAYNEVQKSSKESSNSRELHQENEDTAFRLMSEAQTAYGTAAYHFSNDINGPAKGFKLDARYGKYLQYFYKPDDNARRVDYKGVTTKPTNTESLTDSTNPTNTNTNSPAQKPKGP